MTQITRTWNRGFSVLVDGKHYDFPDLLCADAFVHAVRDGAIPNQAAELLNDSRYFFRQVNH